MKKVKIFALALSAGLFASCNSDDDGNGNTPEVPVQEPSTYTFQRDGESTVSFGGQNTRILMANELVSGLVDFDGATEASLTSMYTHSAGNNDFSDSSLNESGKNIKSKVAASSDYFSTNSAASEIIKQHFQDIISNQTQTVFPNYLSTASAGVPGQVVVGNKTRYLNAKGAENNQLMAKGLIGALIADQALNNYLSVNVLDAGSNVSNNNDGITEENKPYTTMEHKWDEAFGYIYGGNVDNASDPNASESAHNSYLHKYIQKVDTNDNFSGISDAIFNAFKKGRYAIVIKDYELRNAQSAIIKEKISTVIAVRAIHYLYAGKQEIEAGSRTAAFHDLSEGLGFLYSLQFTQDPATSQPYMSAAEVTELIDSILANDGLWTVTPETLQTACEAIASKFNFTVEQAM